ncbi:MAG: dephospho-CoA kinase [Candidatus Xenobium sp.]|nr:dephospho-CoA kinase [Burkholderiales bacterium]
MILGLTGSIAAGKSTVARVLLDKGAALVDADQVSRDLTGPGSPVLSRLVERFGSEILDSEGRLDRANLALRVFNSAEDLEALNEITHPAIWKESLSRLAELGARHPVVVLMAPLLLEHGAEAIVDQVWVVDLPLEEQLRRLIDRDGLSRDEALRRIRSQMPAAEKAARADVLIDNSGTLEQTRALVDTAWEDWVTPLLEIY